jgi:O-antigen biosynthesis protein
LHYLLQGAAEGRSPGPQFDGAAYLRAYPDVAAGAVNPLLHYITTGAAEGRVIAAPPSTRLPNLPLTDANYARWVRAYDTPDETSLAALRARLAGCHTLPRISVIRLAGHDGAVAESLRRQVLPPAEILPAEGSAQANAALARAAGDLVLFLHEDTELAPLALAEIALAAAENRGAELFYADEDRVTAEGARCEPWLKPGWDPDLMMSLDLIGRTGAYRRALLGRIGGLRADAGYDLALRAADAAEAVHHIPRVLFHGRAPVRPGADAAILREHLAAKGCHAAVTSLQLPTGALRVAPALAETPRVSVIVPTRDRARLLARCADGVLRATDYPALELIIVDNGSSEPASGRLFARLWRDPRVRILPYAGAFNWSAMNNAAVATARGEVVVLLNNDIEVINPGWLRALVAQVLRPGVGAAGAKLLYPDRRVQHVGITLGPGAVAAHLGRYAREDEPGDHGAFVLTRSVAAVTGACLAVRRSLYQAVGGIEETVLHVTNNDIDFCLRLRAAGQRVVLAPDAVVLHLEAASRGLDVSEAHRVRARAERDYLLARWGSLAASDPWRNPNLSVVGEALALASPPPFATA